MTNQECVNHRGMARRDVLRTTGGVALLGLGTSFLSTSGVASEAGDIRWTFETAGDESRSSPTIVDDFVYIGAADTDSGVGYVYAIDSSAGEEVWSHESQGPIYTSSPQVIDGTVYIGDDAGVVYALDAETGDEIWTYETGGKVRASPTAADGRVYVGSFDENMYAFNAADGEKLWSHESAGAIWGSPLVTDGKVFSESTYDHFVLDADSGEEEWSHFTMADNNRWTQPTKVDDRVYWAWKGIGMRYYPYEDESTEWAQGGALELRARSPPTVAYDQVFTGGGDGIFAFDAETGEQEWIIDREVLGSSVRSGVTVADRTVFGGGRTLVAADIADGDIKWERELFVDRSSPTVVDGTLYVAGIEEGDLYAIETGVTGSSVDSRVMQGILGHHEGWSGDSSAAVADAYPVDDPTVQGGSQGGDSDDGDDGFAPGFGLPAGLLSIGGLAYILHRHGEESD